MRLYHFTNAEYGISDLREKHLKIARIEDLNDPFEFIGADLSNGYLRKEMENLKGQYNKTMGLLCFSKNWDNPVQWAHYADGHKGLCLGFDVADGFLAEVNYEDKRLPTYDFLAANEQSKADFLAEMNAYIGPSASREEYQKRKDEFIKEVVPRRLREEIEADKASLEFMKNMLCTKFSHWGYEQEYRYFLYLSSAKSIGDLYFFDFSGELALREVIIGVNSRVTKNQIKVALGASPEIAVFKTRLHDSQFAIEKSLVYKRYAAGQSAAQARD